MALIDDDGPAIRSWHGELDRNAGACRQREATFSTCVSAIRAAIRLGHTTAWGILPESEAEQGAGKGKEPVYLGAPVLNSDGELQAVLCAIDETPRIWSPEDVSILQDLAVQFAAELTTVRTAPHASRVGLNPYELLSTVDDGICLLNADGHCEFINPAGAALLGYRPDDLVGRHWQELIHPTRHAPGNERRDLASGGPIYGEHDLFQCSDGGNLAVKYSAYPVLRAGMPCGAWITFRETAASGRNIRPRRNHSHRFRPLPRDHSTGTLLLFDQEYHCIVARYGVRRAGANPFGRWDGSRVWEVFPPELRDQVEQLSRRVLAEPDFREEPSIEAGMLSVMPVRDVAGNTIAGIITMQAGRTQDETGRPLAQTGMRLASLFEDNPDSIYAVDLQGTFSTANQACSELTGYSLDELQQMNWVTLVAPEDLERSWALFRQVQQGSPTHFQLTLVRKDGRRIPISGACFPMVVEGAITGVYGIAKDLSSQCRERDALRERAERLEEEGQRKDEFLAMLAHELRNPLAPIVNALEVMEQLDIRHPKVERARQVIRRQTRHLIRMVDDLLDVARITRGTIELRRTTADMDAIIHTAVEAVLPRIESKQLELSLLLPPETIAIEADATRLEQIFVNLLDNAAKFTDPGGRIQLSAVSEGAEVVIRVRDTGKGFPSLLQEQIFTPFMQVSPAIDRQMGGLGLGLPLVRSLTELHGGTVAAYSAGTGQGAEFTVRLPLPHQSAPPSEADNDPRSASPRPLRILIVDDNAAALETLAELLPLWGHEVETAQDGHAALERAQTFRPDMVLLDLGLPGMDGYQVAQTLRRDALLGNVPIAAVTGYGQEHDKHRSRAHGFDWHLVKPVEPALLRQVLAEAAGRATPVERRSG